MARSAHTARLIGAAVSMIWSLTSRICCSDGWQQCKDPPPACTVPRGGTKKCGPHRGSGGFHDAGGRPQLDKAKYPNLAAAVAYAHAKGLKADWYLNNCYCADPASSHKDFEGDVDFLVRANLDGVKIDGATLHTYHAEFLEGSCSDGRLTPAVDWHGSGCGGERNIALYQQLLNRTKTNFFIEDCHDSRAAPDRRVPRAPPNESWCPFNTWRNSYDEAYTLYDTALFLLNMNKRNTAAVSRPGCWAMAGMLMVGVDSAHARWVQNSVPMNYSEMQVQFGGECILSSPLILSFDPTNATAIDRVWPIITNTEAIAVNKAWSGSPGAILTESSALVRMWCFQAARHGNSTCAFPSWQVCRSSPR
eukprot:SAG31_NODE_304_length_18019_cov_10.386440_11_plen_363_part_00